MSYRDDVVDSKVYKGYKIEIHYDQDSGSDSPREWDNGTTLCLTHRRMTKQGQEMVGTPDDRIEEVCKGDLDVFTQWANGCVYGYTVTDPAGNELDDSCWGMYDDTYGFPYIYSEAENAVDTDIIFTKRQMALGLVP